MLPDDIENLIIDYVYSREMWLIKQRLHNELRATMFRRDLEREIGFFMYNLYFTLFDPLLYLP